MGKITQSMKILKHLTAGGSITPIEALEHFGCFRLAARISDLKAKGCRIKAELVRQDGKCFNRYSLDETVVPKDLYLSEEAVRQHEYAKK